MDYFGQLLVDRPWPEGIIDEIDKDGHDDDSQSDTDSFESFFHG
jgi:hypothetical protein